MGKKKAEKCCGTCALWGGHDAYKADRSRSKKYGMYQCRWEAAPQKLPESIGVRSLVPSRMCFVYGENCDAYEPKNGSTP